MSEAAESKSDSRDWWKTIACFCMGALFSGAIFLFRDIPTTAEMNEADRDQRVALAAAELRTNAVERDIAAIKADLATLIRLNTPPGVTATR